MSALASLLSLLGSCVDADARSSCVGEVIRPEWCICRRSVTSKQSNATNSIGQHIDDIKQQIEQMRGEMTQIDPSNGNPTAIPNNTGVNDESDHPQPGDGSGTTSSSIDTHPLTNPNECATIEQRTEDANGNGVVTTTTSMETTDTSITIVPKEPMQLQTDAQVETPTLDPSHYTCKPKGNGVLHPTGDLVSIPMEVYNQPISPSVTCPPTKLSAEDEIDQHIEASLSQMFDEV